MTVAERALIDRDLGGFDKFREAFIEAGKTQFGSGWCWLALKDGKLRPGFWGCRQV